MSASQDARQVLDWREEARALRDAQPELNFAEIAERLGRNRSAVWKAFHPERTKEFEARAEAKRRAARRLANPPVVRVPEPAKVCPVCSEEWIPGSPWYSANQEHCSRRCVDRGRTLGATARYPSKAELEELYVGQRLNDSQVGARFGRGALWAAKARDHHGVAGVPRGGHRRDDEPRTTGRNWNLRLKGEACCRMCDAPPVHLHHIVPRGMAKAGIVDVQRNGMPLCNACHRGWHNGNLLIFRENLLPAEYEFAVEAGGRLWASLKYPERPAAWDAYRETA